MRSGVQGQGARGAIRTAVVVAFATIAGICHAQVSEMESIAAKYYSKKEALYRAKGFVLQEVLQVHTSVVQVSIDALAATDSGELTSLVYESGDRRGGMAFPGDGIRVETTVPAVDTHLAPTGGSSPSAAL